MWFNTGRILVLYFLLLCCLNPAAYGQNKINIAVLDFTSEGGLTESEASTLTNRFRSMLVKTRTYNVLERGRMEEVLGEIGFQMSGCTSTECAVEVGKILNVQQMISGTIGKLGSTYTVDISIIDVGTARIIKTLYEDYKGEIDGLLALMEPISQRLTGQQVKEEVMVTKDEGGLKVISGRVKADVYLNNEKIGQTPLEKSGIRSGEYEIKLKADGYADLVDKITIRRGTTVEFRKELEKFFTLNITSQPSGARVYINNQYLAQTPKKQRVKEGMAFKLKITKENYQDWERDVTVQKDLDITARLKLLEAYQKQLAEKTTSTQKAPGKKGSKKWLWIGGGTIVVGGAAAAILLSGGGDDTKTTASGFPEPFGRP